MGNQEGFDHNLKWNFQEILNKDGKIFPVSLYF